MLAFVLVAFVAYGVGFEVGRKSVPVVEPCKSPTEVISNFTAYCVFVDSLYSPNIRKKNKPRLADSVRKYGVLIH